MALHNTIWLAVCLSTSSAVFAQQARESVNKMPQLYQLTQASAVEGWPYMRYSTRDRFGRKVSFYVSEAKVDAAVPLVVYVQGSGCASHFARRGERIVPRNGHYPVQAEFANQARCLIVEKPGVAYLDDPQAADERAGSPEFRKQHTLDRWAEAVVAAIKAVLSSTIVVDKTRVLVVGHSEGGLVASRVARQLRDEVTHVAILAGEGPTQLYSLISLARKGVFFGHVSTDPEQRAAHVVEQWQKIQREPDSTEKLFLGFAYKRWSSFLTHSPQEELKAVNAKIYLAQGLRDQAIDPTATDVLYSQLLAGGKSVVYDRIVAADHSFFDEANPDTDGWREQFSRIKRWFLD